MINIQKENIDLDRSRQLTHSPYTTNGSNAVMGKKLLSF